MAKREKPPADGEGMFPAPLAQPMEPGTAATKVPGFDYIQAIRDGDVVTLFWRHAHGVEGRWVMEDNSGGDEVNVAATFDDHIRWLACDRLGVPDVYAPLIVVTTTK